MSDFKDKMHQIRFAPPDLLAVLKGPTSKGSEGRERVRERGGEVKGKEKGNGRGRGREREGRGGGKTRGRDLPD